MILIIVISLLATCQTKKTDNKNNDSAQRIDARWIYVLTDPDTTNKCYFDTQSPVRISTTQYRVWFQIIFSTTVKEETMDFEYKQVMDNCELNCESRQIRKIQSFYYDSLNNHVYTRTWRDPLKSVVPGSIGERMLKVACDFLWKQNLQIEK